MDKQVINLEISIKEKTRGKMKYIVFQSIKCNCIWSNLLNCINYIKSVEIKWHEKKLIKKKWYFMFFFFVFEYKPMAHNTWKLDFKNDCLTTMLCTKL